MKNMHVTTFVHLLHRLEKKIVKYIPYFVKFYSLLKLVLFTLFLVPNCGDRVTLSGKITVYLLDFKEEKITQVYVIIESLRIFTQLLRKNSYSKIRTINIFSY